MKNNFWIKIGVLSMATLPIFSVISCTKDNKNNQQNLDLAILNDYNKIKDVISTKNADNLAASTNKKVTGDIVELDDLGISFNIDLQTSAIFKIINPYDPETTSLKVNAALSRGNIRIDKDFVVKAAIKPSIIEKNIDNFLPQELEIFTNSTLHDFKNNLINLKIGDSVSIEQLGINLEIPNDINVEIKVAEKYNFFNKQIAIEMQLNKGEIKSKSQKYIIKYSTIDQKFEWLKNTISEKNNQEILQIKQELEPGTPIDQKQLGINLNVPKGLEISLFTSEQVFDQGIYVNVIVKANNRFVIERKILIFSSDFTKYDDFYFADQNNHTEKDAKLIKDILASSQELSKWEISYFYLLTKDIAQDNKIIDFSIGGMDAEGKTFTLKQEISFKNKKESAKYQINNEDWITDIKLITDLVGNDILNAINLIFNNISRFEMNINLPYYYPTIEYLPANANVPNNFTGYQWEKKNYNQIRIIFQPNSEALNQLLTLEKEKLNLDQASLLSQDIKNKLAEIFIEYDSVKLENVNQDELKEIQNFIDQEKTLSQQEPRKSQIDIKTLPSKTNDKLDHVELTINNLPLKYLPLIENYLSLTVNEMGLKNPSFGSNLTIELNQSIWNNLPFDFIIKFAIVAFVPN